MKYFNVQIAVEEFKKNNHNFNHNFNDIITYILAGEIVNMETNKEYYINGMINKNLDIKKDYNSYIINNNEYNYYMKKGYIHIYNHSYDYRKQFEIIIDNDTLYDVIIQFYHNIDNVYTKTKFNNTKNDILDLVYINKFKRTINNYRKRTFENSSKFKDYVWTIYENNINEDGDSRRNYYIPVSDYTYISYSHINSLNSIIIDNSDLFNIKNELRFPNFPKLKDYKILDNVEIIPNVYIYNYNTNILLEIVKRFLHIENELNLLKFVDCSRNVYYIDFNNIRNIYNTITHKSNNWLKEIKNYLCKIYDNNLINQNAQSENKQSENKQSENIENKQSENKQSENKQSENKQSENIEMIKKEIAKKYYFKKKKVINENNLTNNFLKCYFTGVPLYNEVYVFDIYKYKNIDIHEPIHILLSPFIIHFYPNFIKDFEYLTDTKIILFKTNININIFEVIDIIGNNINDKKILKSLFRSAILTPMYNQSYTISNIINENEMKIACEEMGIKYNFKIYKDQLNVQHRIVLLNDFTYLNSEILIDLILGWKMPFLARIKYT
jgi:hypothetical protein